MNGVLMTEQSNTYHYRAYLETLVNYNREEGATKLTPQGWVRQLNVIEKMGATGANSDIPTKANWKGNAELRALISRLLSENWDTFIIRPHLTPLKTDKCLVSGVQLDFELFLNPNSVYLMGTPNKGTLVAKKFPAIHNEDIKVILLMRKVSLNASVYVRLQKERQLRKILCATLWFEVKSAPFPFMAEPPSGNKIMCLWADFLIERWWVYCIRMQTWRHGQKPLCVSKVLGNLSTTEFEWKRISLQNPRTDRG